MCNDAESSGIDEMTPEELRLNLRISMKQLVDADNERFEMEEDADRRQAQILGWLRFKGWGDAADGIEKNEWYGFDPVAGQFRPGSQTPGG